jgi:hypothetical protein
MLVENPPLPEPPTQASTRGPRAPARTVETANRFSALQDVYPQSNPSERHSTLSHAPPMNAYNAYFHDMQPTLADAREAQEKKSGYDTLPHRAPIEQISNSQQAREYHGYQPTYAAHSSANPSAHTSANPSAQPSPRFTRRETEKKAISLTRAGHLVLEIPVPSRYLDKCAEKRGREFTHIR